MIRVAILGGGISGLSAAWECEQQRRGGQDLDWQLFEASDHLGGLLSTTRLNTADGEYVLEDGPDGWLTDKPWARELAVELGLGAELLPCEERDRRTLLWLQGRLVTMPPHMRLMVPGDLDAISNSPWLSESAKAAYRTEPNRAWELQHTVPVGDESVANFVRRHFGEDVLHQLARPLLAGIFGGDVDRLSVRAVMPLFVQMEAEFGSLVQGLATMLQRRSGSRQEQPTFTSLRRGMSSMAEALRSALPQERLHLSVSATALRQTAGPKAWTVDVETLDRSHAPSASCVFDHVLLSLPLDTTHRLLGELDNEAASLLPREASSAVLVTFCWPPAIAKGVELPDGFGFLVAPPTPGMPVSTHPRLLAATFPGQKYAGRLPPGAKAVRAFVSGDAAAELMFCSDAAAAAVAWEELAGIFPGLIPPRPELTTVRRWPRSLPQYEVGHLDRLRALEARMVERRGLQLLGNSYRGVGLPDLIRDARAAVRKLREAHA